MRRLVVPLMVLGAAQWGVLVWWQFVDGLTIDVSLGVLFRELLGLTPRVAWDPAQRLLVAFLHLTPGTIFIFLGFYLLVRTWGERMNDRRNSERQVERARAEIIERMRGAAGQDNDPLPPGKPRTRLRRLAS